MDMNKLLTPLDDNEKVKNFYQNFIKTFVTPAFGAISKTEVDNLVFGLLIDAGALDPKSQVYEIARDLNVTPAKARNLLFQWQLRSMGNGDVLKKDLIEALSSVRFVKDGDLLSFGVESPLLREELRSRLKHLQIYADASFSSEIIRISVDHFVEFLDDFLGDIGKKKIQQALIKDNQIEDNSYKAAACRILKGIAEKAAGEAGGELTDLLGKAVSGLVEDNAVSVIEIYKRVTSTSTKA
ncbi:MAG: hypothetical protein OXI88_00660 [Gammaproteobacteria bacterium]|nr:hypothetical protein [Gammaproteobacteria bacterium]MDE0510292.1 hypothetical protein [Gammaproteobacteria bacterium]